jgi:thiamine pyrophosphokinase
MGGAVRGGPPKAPLACHTRHGCEPACPDRPRLVVFAGGEVADAPALGRWAADADLVVAADSGLGRALDAGLTPDVVVGDMDSVRPEDLDAARGAGVEVVSLDPVNKDQTDLECAVEHGLARLGGPARILLAGIAGGRLDHTLAAMSLMARLAAEGHIVEAGDGRAWATVLGGGRRCVCLTGVRGEIVSFIPVMGDAAGVTLQGLRYPLERAVLPFGSSRGVSNEFAAPAARASIESGYLLVVRPGAPGGAPSAAPSG